MCTVNLTSGRRVMINREGTFCNREFFVNQYEDGRLNVSIAVRVPIKHIYQGNSKSAIMQKLASKYDFIELSGNEFDASIIAFLPIKSVKYDQKFSQEELDKSKEAFEKNVPQNFIDEVVEIVKRDAVIFVSNKPFVTNGQSAMGIEAKPRKFDGKDVQFYYYIGFDKEDVDEAKEVCNGVYFVNQEHKENTTTTKDWINASLPTVGNAPTK